MQLILWLLRMLTAMHISISAKLPERLVVASFSFRSSGPILEKKKLKNWKNLLLHVLSLLPSSNNNIMKRQISLDNWSMFISSPLRCYLRGSQICGTVHTKSMLIVSLYLFFRCRKRQPERICLVLCLVLSSSMSMDVHIQDSVLTCRR